jgi:fructokinase
MPVRLNETLPPRERAKLRFGVDLGGSKIEIAALEGDAERLRRRVSAPRDDYDATVEAVAGLVAAAEAELGRTGTVGIGIPGSLSPATGLVRNANSTWLNGKPLARDLGARLGRDVRLANDANCLALSEAWDGAGAGASVVFAAILGTGVGGGLVVDGRLVEGANRIAGEWGHTVLPGHGGEAPAPSRCWCGREGCVETYLSGPALARDHRARGGAADLDAAGVVAAAAGGKAAAAAALEAWFARLARALAGIVNVLDPDLIVVGGGLSRIAALYDEIPRRWGRHIFSDAVATRIVPARHGDSSGVRGAARLWPLEPDRA